MMKNNILFTLPIGFIIYCYYNSIFSLFSFIINLSFILFIRFVFIHADCDMLLLYYTYFGKSTESLKGKVIWITGASTGIGRGIALKLAREKVRLVLSARSEDKLQQVKKKCIDLGNISSEDVLVIPFDMTDYDKHEWAFSAIMDHFGKLDILISNAGRSQRGYWENIDTAVDKALFELNVFSLVNLCRIVTRHFLKSGGGKHVVVSSNAGKMGVPGSASYVGSKFALGGYFEALRAEKGSKGISVNMLIPGPTESNLMELLFAETMDEKLDRKRVGKMMSTERCAHLSVVAMANNVSEAWICQQPVLFVQYIAQYIPSLITWFMNNFDFAALVMKLRDGTPLVSKTKQQ